jgi:hypothetical protein
MILPPHQYNMYTVELSSTLNEKVNAFKSHFVGIHSCFCIELLLEQVDRFFAVEQRLTTNQTKNRSC